jgi:hypothetical protein
MASSSGITAKATPLAIGRFPGLNVVDFHWLVGCPPGRLNTTTRWWVRPRPEDRIFSFGVQFYAIVVDGSRCH